MFSQTLEIADINELTSFWITFLILLVGGALGGFANYWGTGPLQPGAPRRLSRELLIGIIAAITVPSFLSLLSSGLLSASRLSAVDALKIFAVSIVYTVAMRQLFAGIYLTAALERTKKPVLSLLEMEILRGVEYQRVAADQLPSLPTDLRVSPGLLGNRIKSLQDRGLVDHRQDAEGGPYWFVTKAGWEALNEILRKAAE